MNLTLDDIPSIRQEYKNTLILPPKNKISSSQFFLCPVGLVGAGKSTVIKPLSEKLSLVRISSDEVREILKRRNVGYEQLMEIVQPLTGELATQGFSLAFDADCGNPKTKEFILALAQKVKAEVFWIHINPPEDFILHKLRTYNHTWLFKNEEEAVENYFQQKKKRREENTHFDFLATIDTSRTDLAIQIEQTANLIKEKTSL
jgi:predicted kinase